MKTAISIFIFLIAAGMAALYLVHVREQQYIAALEIEEGPELFCGTHVFSPPLAENAKVGKQLFRANCAACHKLNATSTGPALRNVHQRNSTEDIIKFMRNDFSGALKYNGERKCTAFPNLSDEDIQSILLYTN